MGRLFEQAPADSGRTEARRRTGRPILGRSSLTDLQRDRRASRPAVVISGCDGRLRSVPLRARAAGGYHPQSMRTIRHAEYFVSDSTGSAASVDPAVSPATPGPAIVQPLPAASEIASHAPSDGVQVSGSPVGLHDTITDTPHGGIVTAKDIQSFWSGDRDAGWLY
jgi:hypothetical protein